MSVKILFLSDFHYREGSILTKNDYVECLCETINEIYDSESIDILVIAGDLADKGGSQKIYEDVVSLVNEILGKLKIENVVIVPGNHDVNRKILEELASNNGCDAGKMYKCVNKYDYFNCIKNIKGITIDTTKVITSYQYIKDSFLFLGIDSNARIGVEDGKGYVETDRLKDELNNLNKDPRFNKAIKVAIFHHNPNTYVSLLEKNSNNNNDSKNSTGNFDLKNWYKLKKLLDSYNIHVVLTGHVHGSMILAQDDCNYDNNETYYSTVGSIGMDFNLELNEILKHVNKDELGKWHLEKYEELEKWIQNNEVYLSVSNHHNTFGIIDIDENGRIKEQHYKYICDEGHKKWISWFNNPKTHTLRKITEVKGENPFIKLIEVSNDTTEEYDFERELKTYIRKERLFKSGHFHWSNQSCLNWIDTSILLSDSLYCTRIVDNMIKKYNKLFDESDFIVGLGIKGSILMSNIRYCYSNKKYTYYPEIIEQHNECELLVDGKNTFSDDVKNIIILTDVVHSGNTIKKYISNCKISLEKVNVAVICIIYTGSSTIQPQIVINATDKIPVKYLLNLQRVNCSNASCSNCDIYNDKLDIVYEM